MASSEKEYPRVIAQPLNWNGWKETIDCVNSLLQQDYPNLGIRIVDNGSDDGSVSQLRNEFPSLEIIENRQDLGYAAGQNVGLRDSIAKGDQYVVLLNNDAILEASAISAMVAVAEADPSVGAVSVVMRYKQPINTIQFYGGGKLINWRGKLINAKGPNDRLDYVSGACLLLRVKTICEVGLMDERFFLYWEDVDYSVRMRAHGWLLKVAENALVYHRGSASMSPRSSARDRIIAESTVRYLRKHARFPIFSIMMAIGLRSLRRIVHLDYEYLVSTVLGTWDGFHAPRHLPEGTTK